MKQTMFVATLLSLMFPLTILGQQFQPSPYSNSDVTRNSNAYPAPPSSNGWQREALQMMRNSSSGDLSPSRNNTANHPGPLPKASQRAYVPPVHIPPASNSQAGVYIQPEMRRASATNQSGVYAGQGVVLSSVQPAQQNVQELPRTPTPAGLSPAAGGFNSRTGPLAQTNRSQSSSNSLTKRRAPGLQERIEGLLSSNRYNSNNNRRNSTPELAPRTGRNPDLQPPRSTQSEPRRAMTPRRTYINPANLTRLPKTQSRTTREPRSIVSNGLERPTVASTIPSDDRFDRKDSQVGLLQVQSLSRLEKYSPEDQQIETVAASDPVLTDPVQDPFADQPPVQSPVRHAHESDGVAYENTDQISILNKPIEKGYSIGAETQYDYAPTYQEQEPSVNELRQNEFDANPLNQPAIQDDPAPLIAGGQDPEQLEELPSAADITAAQDEDLMPQFGQDDPIESPLDRSCEEFQRRLLNNKPITSISINISPLRSGGQSKTVSSREWTDRRGNVVTTGAMQDLSRGYVILDNGMKISRARLSDQDLAYISELWQIPEECTIVKDVFTPRAWCPQTVTWKASSLCHKPLYFENIQLERYGHSHGPILQPIQSTFHFFKSLVFLPYQATLHPATECQYALGFYRPGDCAPWLRDPIPISLDGIKSQTLVSVGLAYIP